MINSDVSGIVESPSAIEFLFTFKVCIIPSKCSIYGRNVAIYLMVGNVDRQCETFGLHCLITWPQYQEL